MTFDRQRNSYVQVVPSHLPTCSWRLLTLKVGTVLMGSTRNLDIRFFFHEITLDMWHLLKKIKIYMLRRIICITMIDHRWHHKGWRHSPCIVHFLLHGELYIYIATYNLSKWVYTWAFICMWNDTVNRRSPKYVKTANRRVYIIKYIIMITDAPWHQWPQRHIW